MAKIQLKSDNINPFRGLFSIFKQFDRSGLRQTIDSALGKRGTTKAAFTYGDVFVSLFGSYLCDGDCIEDMMDVKSFWDGRDKLRICSSDVARGHCGSSPATTSPTRAPRTSLTTSTPTKR